MRARHRRKNLAKIDEFGLQALDFETNGAAAGEGHRHDAGGRVALGEFDREKIEQRVLAGLIETAALAGDNAFEPQRGPAAPVIRRFVLEAVGIGGIHPVEAIERHDEAVLARLPENVARP